MQTLFELVSGIGLAGLTIWGIHAAPRLNERRSYAFIILICAVIYVGLAITDGTSAALLTEAVGLMMFGGFAWAGWRVHPGWLVAGLIGHALWDMGHEWALLSTDTPSWYVFICLYYDVSVAVYVAMWARKKAV